MTLARPPAVVLHVGLHKTGTTWLQRRIFAAKHGRELQYCGDIDLIYRQFLIPGPGDFSAATARAAFAPLLEQAAGNGQPVVISGENLAGRPFHARHLREITAGRLAETFPEARILLTIREQNAIISSMYGQYLRFGYSSSLQAFLQEPPPGAAYQPVLDRSFYDYARLIETYERFFPRDRILVAPFEWMLAEPDALLARLSAATETVLTPVGTETARRVENSAWSDLAYEALRHLNRFDSQDSRWQRKPLLLRPNAIAARIDRLTPDRLRRSMRKARKALIDEMIGDRYAASNRVASERIGIDLAAYGYRAEAR